MADFRLSDEQRQFQQLAREFSQKEIVPKASQFDSTAEFPSEVCRQSWELGFMNLFIPIELGGLGLRLWDACLIAEEFGAACAAISSILVSHNLAQAPVIAGGTDEQKREFLEPLANEYLYAACSPAELSCKVDPKTVQVTAKASKDEYVLSGQKTWVSNASVARWYYVLASTDPTQGIDGLSAFVVPADSKGIVVGQRQPMLGCKACDVREITFVDVKVSRQCLIGQVGQGWKVTKMGFARCLPLWASVAVGLARAAMQHSIVYAKERTTFGKPIAQHQAVSFMLADMAKNIESSRLLAWQAAWLYDHEMPMSKQALMAKAFAVDTAMKVATDAVQIFGGYGYSREYPVEKLMRDAKVLQIYQGSSLTDRVMIAGSLIGV
ncbi:MAG: acyl-CoA dehydrogenase family protein [Candidatus Melainabacteria bacterium]|nr:acyl-CoA dehydrogenase family protein [Candidatus Melainabacteria bacterium]